MKEGKDYIQEISEIRSMMERSSKFLSLSGWAGIFVGLYALIGAYFAYEIFYAEVNFPTYTSNTPEEFTANVWELIFLALGILALAIGTATFLSWKKAKKRREKVWNFTSRRLLSNMAVPLVSGGILIIILLLKNLVELLAPLSLLFYGIALYNASKYTYNDVKFLGIFQIVLGLISAYFVNYGLICWAVGFGMAHIVYGVYLHLKYER